MTYYDTDIRVKMNKNEKAKIQLAAKKEGKGLSRYVREALEVKMNTKV